MLPIPQPLLFLSCLTFSEGKSWLLLKKSFLSCLPQHRTCLVFLFLIYFFSIHFLFFTLPSFFSKNPIYPNYFNYFIGHVFLIYFLLIHKYLYLTLTLFWVPDLDTQCFCHHLHLKFPQTPQVHHVHIWSPYLSSQTCLLCSLSKGMVPQVPFVKASFFIFLHLVNP